MSHRGDLATRGRGTRFRLFPQLPVLPAYREPETVWISRPAGTIAPGPADDRMYVVDAVGKAAPYEYPYLPPYTGRVAPPALPDARGHFDHLEVGSSEFHAAHMYGTVRRVLDIWESYAGHRVGWHFHGVFDRLELVPYVNWDNAHAGFGFIETGYGRDERGERHLHCLNFDVLAHELGHVLVYSEVGTPARDAETVEYFGFHESSGDLVALICVLHFHKVVDHVLRETGGNLYIHNEMSRIGELSQTKQIRVADNALRMSDVADVSTPVELMCQPERHQLAQPLTGAIFDILIDVYQQTLVEGALISRELDRLSGRVTGIPVDDPMIDARFAEAYAGRHEAFKAALLQARDYVGIVLACAWQRVSPDRFTYVAVRDALLSVDRGLTGGKYGRTILESFDWRQIGPRRSSGTSTARPGNGGRMG